MSGRTSAGVTARARAAVAASADASACSSSSSAGDDGDGERQSEGDPHGDAPRRDDATDDVVVVGKLLPRAKWQQDEDGNPVPTLLAKTIVIED